MIYLDNAATAKPCEQTVEAVTNAMTDCFGNASSLHEMGVRSERIIASAKRTLLSELGEGDIIFTSGATESNNTAIRSTAQLYRRNGNKIVTTAIEHPSVARVTEQLEKQGFEIVRLSPRDSGDFVKALADCVDDNTLMVSCMAVNNETGYINDVKRLYRLVKSRNPKTIVHVDAVQGFLKVPLEGDLISISGHKIHASKGIGALYIKKGVRLSPLLYGGGQQKNLRSGTEPVELIAGLEAAVKAYPKNSAEHFELLRDRLVKGLSALSGVIINSGENCVPNIVNFSVEGVRSEIMLHFLEERGIYVSSGSACSKGKTSGVLAAFGIDDRLADSAIRASMSRYNTERDIDALVEGVSAGIERFRR